MPSRSLLRWEGERAEALDEIEAAHASVGGGGPGRRYATQQLNYAYATLLSSHFQGFCRDLHSECVDHVLTMIPANLHDMIGAQFLWGRALDKGNPNPGNVGSDFGRFTVSFWAEIRTDRGLNERRQAHLEELNVWRNAIAHHDFNLVRLGGSAILHLATVRQWRSSLNHLAASFDRVMRSHLAGLLGREPWPP